MRVVIAGISWILLIAGSVLAARRSRFVLTGRPQVSLWTFFVASTFIAGYFILYRNPLDYGWEHAAALPVLISAFLGYWGYIVTGNIDGDNRGRAASNSCA
jgi:hypothetical protein